MIGVFDDIPGRIRTTGAEIYGIHEFGFGFFRPIAELMQAYFIGFRSEPGQIQPLRPLIPGADGILPVEAGHKVAARIAHHRNVQLPHHVDHVPAETVFVRRGMIRFIDAAVHRPAEVLDKGPVNPWIDPPDGKILIQDHGCFFHGFILLILSPRPRSFLPQ